MTATLPDYETIKTKQRATWGAGDYGKVGVTLQITGEELAESMAMKPGSKVLDVAAGNGNATLAMARRFCAVTSTDYVPALLAEGRARAEAEGLAVEYREADAENLPFGDGSFDAVVSTFGVMFTPNQHKSASELVRVCRKGGRIGLATWTPAGFIGRVFRVIGGHVSPQVGVESPANWGRPEWLAERFGSVCERVSVEEKSFLFVYPSPSYFLEFFRAWYGPVQKAFDALDDAGKAALERDLLALIEEMNTATDGTMRVPSAYAEVVIEK